MKFFLMVVEFLAKDCAITGQIGTRARLYLGLMLGRGRKPETGQAGSLR